jgi:hypothetical protein
MAKRNGTHSLLRDKERFVHELIQRKFSDSVDVVKEFQRSATSTYIPGGVIFYSDQYAVLFRDGKLWDAAQHGLDTPTQALVQLLPPIKFESKQATPPPGSEGPLGEGWL